MPLFYSHSGKKLTRAGIAYILKKYVRLAREQNPVLYPDKVSPHTLRHSKSMHLLEGGVNLVYIRAALTLKFMFTFLEHIGFHFLTSFYRNIRFEP